MRWLLALEPFFYNLFGLQLSLTSMQSLLIVCDEAAKS